MTAKRNKEANDVEAQAAAAAAAEAEKAAADAEAEQAEQAQADEKAKAEKPAPINADKMAADIKVSGNSYQQYARQMFKDRLEASR